MAYIHITEFGQIHNSTGVFPPLAHQKIQLTGRPIVSNSFHPSTRSIRVTATVDVTIVVGLQPEATSEDTPLWAKTWEYFSIPEGHGFRLGANLLKD